MGPSGPAERGGLGPSGPAERGIQGPSGPAERGTQGPRWGRLLAAAAAGYMIGTVPSADLAARLASGGSVDLRSAGSGNPGGANAYTLLGPRWGYAVIGVDIAKGTVAAVVGRALAGGDGSNVAGAASVIGHCLPVWSGGRGGKGVGASVGQCLATFPAYFPVDLAVAAVTSTARWRGRARAATLFSSVLWVLSGALWWRRRWPNLWGPRPTIALPLANLASSAVIAFKFLSVPDPTLGSKGQGGPPSRPGR